MPDTTTSWAAGLLAGLSLLLVSNCPAQSPAKSNDQTEKAIAYRTPEQGTAVAPCLLDIYYPRDVQDFATIIWFHGGGLTSGQRQIPPQLIDQGVAVVAVGYRLSPQVKVTECIDDAAAAVAWTYQNIEKYGGSNQKLFISGHSAGGYLTSMLGLDASRLRKYDIDANTLAGLIAFSGHAITHFTARQEQGIDRKQPIIDELAPLFHVRPDAPPLFLITGDRELELLGRYEENAYLWRMMKIAGHKQTTLEEIQGANHGGMAEPAFPLLLNFIRQNTPPIKTER
ncbi:MAG: alpha/beta hydrolase [Pirellulaceae bacterium]|nr:alpha/beta hydrolase [Pirellulaceae bacterium]